MAFSFWEDATWAVSMLVRLFQTASNHNTPQTHNMHTSLFLCKCRKLHPHCCRPLAVLPVRCLFSSGTTLGLLPLAHCWASHCFQVPISTNACDKHLCTRRFLSSLEVDSQHGMLGLMTPVTRSHAL